MNFNKLTFSEWMNQQFEDNWPTGDEGLTTWNRYLEYLKENDGTCE